MFDLTNLTDVQKLAIGAAIIHTTAVVEADPRLKAQFVQSFGEASLEGLRELDQMLAVEGESNG